MKSRLSEIVLLLILLTLVALIRIYYGGENGLIVVWKGQPGFADTIVDLPAMLKLSREELKAKHPSVHWQLVAMDLIEDNVELDSLKYRKPASGADADRAPAPAEAGEDGR